MPRHGASPTDWAHFDLALGLGDRLLPVVSNPEATISPRSTMKGLGKTPSKYYSEGLVGGIAKWTARKAASTRELEQWSAEPDYGICIRTGRMPWQTDDEPNLVAIDMDSDKAEVVVQAHALAKRHLGDLPVRFREGSEKCLLLVQVEGETLYKRVCHLADKERIEILATGQQFVAAGTHPSGSRYDWLEGLPGGAPVVTGEAFEAFWLALNDALGVEPPSSASERKRGERIAMDDERLDWLEANYEHFGYGRDGQLFIPCPFKDGHSMDSGDTEAAYFPAGSGGYEQGHYACLHASCAGRSDGEFDEATGYSGSLLETLPVVVDEATGEAEARLPKGLTRVPKGVNQGRIEATLPNLKRVLQAAEWLGWEIALDDFSADVVIRRAGDDGGWQRFTDTDYTDMRIGLEERGFMAVGRDLIRDAIHAHASKRRFDSAVQWLEGLQWDGVPRVDTFLSRYFGAADDDYTRAVSRYWWSAHAGRVLDPGCQCDMVPILVGDQGAGKTQAVKAMVPVREHYIEVNLEHKDADLSRKMRGALLGELGELRGLQGRSAEANKAWVSAQEEEWTPKYQEYTTTLKRRLVFVGTTNRDDFLGDATGERRWLPVRVGATDIAGVARDREQLWAEAAAIWRKEGVAWSEAYNLAKEHHAEFKAHDIWEAAVARWLDKVCTTSEDGVCTTSTGETILNVEDVFFYALGKSTAQVAKNDEMRMGNVLHVLGFKRSRRRIEGVIKRVWVRGVNHRDHLVTTSNGEGGAHANPQ